MLNSTGHEILTAQNTKTLKKAPFLASILSDIVIIMLIDVKMPTIVGILTSINMINTMLSWVEHEKKFYNLGAWLTFFLFNNMNMKSKYVKTRWTAMLLKHLSDRHLHMIWRRIFSLLVATSIHLITFAKSLDPDHDWHKVRPDLVSPVLEIKLFDSLLFFFIFKSYCIVKINSWQTMQIIS